MLISKNGTRLSVTRGAYNDIFKSMGYAPISADSKSKKESKNSYMAPKPEKNLNNDVPFGNMLNTADIMEEDNDDDEYDVVLEEMTVKQLVEYADDNDIDLGEATRKADIIEAIRKAR